jgi:hypothetical protein
MSVWYNLVCPETKDALWVGQGRTIYSNEGAIKVLCKWLEKHEGKQIIYVAYGSSLLDDCEIFYEKDGELIKLSI